MGITGVREPDAREPEPNQHQDRGRALSVCSIEDGRFHLGNVPPDVVSHSWRAGIFAARSRIYSLPVCFHGNGAISL